MDNLKNLTPKQRELLMRRLRQAQEAKETPAEPERIPALPRAADGGGAFPVSFAQERFWFLDRLEPGSTAYNIPAAIDLRGHLDAAAIAAALGEIVRRHESLRTTFGLDGGSPMQRVHPPAPGALPVPITDLSGLPPERRDE